MHHYCKDCEMFKGGNMDCYFRSVFNMEPDPYDHCKFLSIAEPHHLMPLREIHETLHKHGVA